MAAKFNSMLLTLGPRVVRLRLETQKGATSLSAKSWTLFSEWRLDGEARTSLPVAEDVLLLDARSVRGPHGLNQITAAVKVGVAAVVFFRLNLDSCGVGVVFLERLEEKVDVGRLVDGPRLLGGEGRSLILAGGDTKGSSIVVAEEAASGPEIFEVRSLSIVDAFVVARFAAETIVDVFRFDPELTRLNLPSAGAAIPRTFRRSLVAMTTKSASLRGDVFRSTIFLLTSRDSVFRLQDGVVTGHFSSASFGVEDARLFRLLCLRDDAGVALLCHARDAGRAWLLTGDDLAKRDCPELTNVFEGIKPPSSLIFAKINLGHGDSLVAMTTRGDGSETLTSVDIDGMRRLEGVTDLGIGGGPSAAAAAAALRGFENVVRERIAAVDAERRNLDDKMEMIGGILRHLIGCGIEGRSVGKIGTMPLVINKREKMDEGVDEKMEKGIAVSKPDFQFRLGNCVVVAFEGGAVCESDRLLLLSDARSSARCRIARSPDERGRRPGALCIFLQNPVSLGSNLSLILCAESHHRLRSIFFTKFDWCSLPTAAELLSGGASPTTQRLVRFAESRAKIEAPLILMSSRVDLAHPRHLLVHEMGFEYEDEASRFRRDVDGVIVDAPVEASSSRREIRLTVRCDSLSRLCLFVHRLYSATPTDCLVVSERLYARTMRRRTAMEALDKMLDLSRRMRKTFRANLESSLDDDDDDISTKDLMTALKNPSKSVVVVVSGECWKRTKLKISSNINVYFNSLHSLLLSLESV